MAMSFDNIRTGKKYYIKNFGEECTFEVHEVMGDGDFRVKDIDTLEMFFLSDFVKYGKGKDYQFEEVAD